SDIASNNRKILSAAILVKQQLFKKLLYEAGIRKENASDYKSPLLFSSGFHFKPAAFYFIKIHLSKNFRIPTFNDLYWETANSEALRPETSHQIEVSNEIILIKNLKVIVTGYRVNISDMIQWVPGIASEWSPQNLNDVRTSGLEIISNLSHNIHNHKIELSATYAYTVSENRETGYQLIYVPYHKTTAAAAYSYHNFSADYQFLFNGGVFTRSDNNPRYNHAPYAVSNVGLHYAFGTKKALKLGLQVRNLFDEHYQVMRGRSFPGRNYNIYLNLNL
nr:TonB-dependent receptor [Flavisolibacter sp.]